MLFAKVLNVSSPGRYVLQINANPIKMIGTSINAALEENFRSEEADFLCDALERQTAILSPNTNNPGNTGPSVRVRCPSTLTRTNPLHHLPEEPRN